MVRPMSAWFTAGFSAPGVRAAFGRTAPAALTMSPPSCRGAGGGTGGRAMLALGKFADGAGATDCAGLDDDGRETGTATPAESVSVLAAGAATAPMAKPTRDATSTPAADARVRMRAQPTRPRTSATVPTVNPNSATTTIAPPTPPLTSPSRAASARPPQPYLSATPNPARLLTSPPRAGAHGTLLARWPTPHRNRA